MASFRYKAVDESGAVVTGVILADTPADVRRELRGMRLFPERVALSKAASPDLADLLPSARGRARQHVAIFTRQCSVLLASGVPIVEALDVLARQAEHRRLSEVLLEVRESVSAGYSFADALSHYPQFFDQAYIEMVASGSSRRPARGFARGRDAIIALEPDIAEGSASSSCFPSMTGPASLSTGGHPLLRYAESLSKRA